MESILGLKDESDQVGQNGFEPRGFAVARALQSHELAQVVRKQRRGNYVPELQQSHVGVWPTLGLQQLPVVPVNFFGALLQVLPFKLENRSFLEDYIFVEIGSHPSKQDSRDSFLEAVEKAARRFRPRVPAVNARVLKSGKKLSYTTPNIKLKIEFQFSNYPRYKVTPMHKTSENAKSDGREGRTDRDANLLIYLYRRRKGRKQSTCNLGGSGREDPEKGIRNFAVALAAVKRPIVRRKGPGLLPGPRSPHCGRVGASVPGRSWVPEWPPAGSCPCPRPRPCCSFAERRRGGPPRTPCSGGSTVLEAGEWGRSSRLPPGKRPGEARPPGSVCTPSRTGPVLPERVRVGNYHGVQGPASGERPYESGEPAQVQGVPEVVSGEPLVRVQEVPDRPALENQRHLGKHPDEPVPLLRVHLVYRSAVQEDSSPRHRNQAQDRLEEGRLAAPGSPDHSNVLVWPGPRVHHVDGRGEVDLVQGVARAAVRASVPHLQVPDHDPPVDLAGGEVRLLRPEHLVVLVQALRRHHLLLHVDVGRYGHPDVGGYGLRVVERDPDYPGPLSGLSRGREVRGQAVEERGEEIGGHSSKREGEELGPERGPLLGAELHELGSLDHVYDFGALQHVVVLGPEGPYYRAAAHGLGEHSAQGGVQDQAHPLQLPGGPGEVPGDGHVHGPHQDGRDLYGGDVVDHQKVRAEPAEHSAHGVGVEEVQGRAQDVHQQVVVDLDGRPYAANGLSDEHHGAHRELDDRQGRVGQGEPPPLVDGLLHVAGGRARGVQAHVIVGTLVEHGLQEAKNEERDRPAPPELREVPEVGLQGDHPGDPSLLLHDLPEAVLEVEVALLGGVLGVPPVRDVGLVAAEEDREPVVQDEDLGVEPAQGLVGGHQEGEVRVVNGQDGAHGAQEASVLAEQPVEYGLADPGVQAHEDVVQQVQDGLLTGAEPDEVLAGGEEGRGLRGRRAPRAAPLVHGPEVPVLPGLEVVVQLAAAHDHVVLVLVPLPPEEDRVLDAAARYPRYLRRVGYRALGLPGLDVRDSALLDDLVQQGVHDGGFPAPRGPHHYYGLSQGEGEVQVPQSEAGLAGGLGRRAARRAAGGPLAGVLVPRVRGVAHDDHAPGGDVLEPGGVAAGPADARGRPPAAEVPGGRVGEEPVGLGGALRVRVPGPGPGFRLWLGLGLAVALLPPARGSGGDGDGVRRVCGPGAREVASAARDVLDVLGGDRVGVAVSEVQGPGADEGLEPVEGYDGLDGGEGVHGEVSAGPQEGEEDLEGGHSHGGRDRQRDVVAPRVLGALVDGDQEQGELRDPGHLDLVAPVYSLVPGGHEGGLVGGGDYLAGKGNDQKHHQGADPHDGGGGAERVPQHEVGDDEPEREHKALDPVDQKPLHGQGVHHYQVEHVGRDHGLAVLDASGLRVPEDYGLPGGLSDGRVLERDGRGLPVHHSPEGHRDQRALDPEAHSSAPVAVLRLHQNLQQRQHYEHCSHVVVASAGALAAARLQTGDEAPEGEGRKGLQQAPALEFAYSLLVVDCFFQVRRPERNVVVLGERRQVVRTDSGANELGHPGSQPREEEPAPQVTAPGAGEKACKPPGWLFFRFRGGLSVLLSTLRKPSYSQVKQSSSQTLRLSARPLACSNLKDSTTSRFSLIHASEAKRSSEQTTDSAVDWRSMGSESPEGPVRVLVWVGPGAGAQLRASGTALLDVLPVYLEEVSGVRDSGEGAPARPEDPLEPEELLPAGNGEQPLRASGADGVGEALESAGLPGERVLGLASAAERPSNGRLSSGREASYSNTCGGELANRTWLTEKRADAASGLARKVSDLGGLQQGVRVPGLPGPRGPAGPVDVGPGVARDVVVDDDVDVGDVDPPGEDVRADQDVELVAGEPPHEEVSFLLE
ncbi:hypothetical protein HWI79_1010 [Cryptosporidium felis]|nr:hypothetical protein HWI79_1010 [Cryptosporidium felis]